MSPERIFAELRYAACRDTGYDWTAPVREISVPSDSDYADALDQDACNLKCCIEDTLLERRRIPQADLEAIVFFFLYLVALAALTDDEARNYLDRIVRKLGPDDADRVMPKQAIFAGIRAALYARSADRVTQIKKAIAVTDIPNVKIRLLELLALAMESTNALRAGATGVRQYAAALRAQPKKPIWVFDDEALWRPLSDRLHAVEEKKEE